MKRIHLTERQIIEAVKRLNENMEVNVPLNQNEPTDTAIRNAAKNVVASGAKPDQVTFTIDGDSAKKKGLAESDSKVESVDVAKAVYQKYGDKLRDMSDEAVYDAIDYVLYNDFGSVYANVNEQEIFTILNSMLQLPINGFQVSFTISKRQLKEARRNMLMRESKRYTKKDFKK